MKGQYIINILKTDELRINKDLEKFYLDGWILAGDIKIESKSTTSLYNTVLVPLKKLTK